MTRRSLLGTSTLPALAATTDSTRSKVFFTGDGLSLTPLEQARLLAGLAEKGHCELDSYSLGGAVERLEKKFAEMLGKEAAVFLPTGTLANHLALRILAGDNRRVLVQGDSHIYCDSGDCGQTLSQLNLIPLGTGRPSFGLDDVKRQVERGKTGRVTTPVGVISIETPVRRHFGEVMPIDEMRAVCTYARAEGIGTHLDGSRIYLASPYTGVSAKEYAELFDTVYVSLWKYFNSTAGAVLAGPKKLLENLFHTRRMFGGGIPHAWPMTALALHHAEGFEARYVKSFDAAQQIFSRVGATRTKQGSHISWLKVADVAAFRKKMSAQGIEVGDPIAAREGLIPLNVNESILRRPVAELIGAFQQSL